MAQNEKLCDLSFHRSVRVCCYPTSFEETVSNLSQDGGLYHQVPYPLELHHFTQNFPLEALETLSQVRVFINDEEEECLTWQVGREKPSLQIQIKKKNPKTQLLEEKMYLLDFFGAVEFSIDLTYILEGEEHRVCCYTKYIPILIKRGSQLYQMEEMLQYIYEHQNEMLINGETKGKSSSGLGKSEKKSLSVYLVLLREIVKLYEEQYVYFLKRAKFRIVQETVIRPVEELHRVTTGTLGYLAKHPHELVEIGNSGGIVVGKKHYLPLHTQMKKPMARKDIYENQVVLGFLNYILNQLTGLCQTLQSLWAGIGESGKSREQKLEEEAEEFFIFLPSQQAMKEGLNACHQLKEQVKQLSRSYQTALEMDGSQVRMPPKFTHTFKKVPEYRRVYGAINRWLEYGEYGLHEDQFLLSFLKTPTLYESYVVTRLNQHLKARGWNLKEQRQFFYEPNMKNWRYQNTTCPNTFVFEKEGLAERLTLYYQPVIYSERDKMTDYNGVDLLRLDAYYYTPDFVLKYQKTPNSKSYYLILDAKFSTYQGLKGKPRVELNKYFYDIRGRTDECKHLGVWFLYGKCTSEDYNSNLTAGHDHTKLCPLMLGVSQEDTENFDLMLRCLEEGRNNL